MFIEQLIAGKLGIDELRQLAAKNLDLVLVEDLNAGQVSILMKECDLVVCQAIAIPIFGPLRGTKKITDGFVLGG